MSIQKIAYLRKNSDWYDKNFFSAFKEGLRRLMPGVINIGHGIENARVNQRHSHQVFAPISVVGFVQRSSSHRSETSFRPLRPIPTKESLFLDFWRCATNLSRACLIVSA